MSVSNFCRICWFAFFVGCLSPALPAQSQTPRFENFIPDLEGAPEMFGFAQGLDGAIYSSIYPDLVRFDGSNWEVVPFGHHIYDLGANNIGRVLLATADGPKFVQTHADGRATIEPIPIEYSDGATHQMFVVVPRRQDVVFYGPRARVICDSNLKTSSWICSDEQQIVGCGANGIYVVDNSDRKLMHIADDGTAREITHLEDRSVDVVVEFDSDAILVWQHDNFEIFEDGQWRRFSNELHAYASEGKRPFFILPMLGGVSVGMHGRFMFLEESGQLRYEIGPETGIPDALIGRVGTDREGNIWLSHSQGLTCVHHGSSIARHPFPQHFVRRCRRIDRRQNHFCFVTPSKVAAYESTTAVRQTPLSLVELHGNTPDLATGTDRLVWHDYDGLYELRDGKREAIALGSIMAACLIDDKILMYFDLSHQLHVAVYQEGELKPLQTLDFDHAVFAIVPLDGRIWLDGAERVLTCLEFDQGFNKPPKRVTRKGPFDINVGLFPGHVIVGIDDEIFRPSLNADGEIVLDKDDLLTAIGPFSGIQTCEDGTILASRDATLFSYAQADQGDPTNLAPASTKHFHESIESFFFDQESGQLLVASDTGNVYSTSGEVENVAQLPLPIIRVEENGEGDVSRKGLAFAFGLPHFHAPTSVRYRHRLQGLETEFSDWSNKTTVEYPRLPAGEFALEVQAMLSGIGQSEAVSPQFKVPTPWFRTWWARTFAVLLAIAGVLLFANQRSRRLLAAQRQMQRKIDEQTSQLREQASQLESANARLKNEIDALQESEQRRDELEGRLLEAERLESLGQMAGGIAHDFNNMLAVVVSNAELMETTTPDDEECREQIMNVALRASELCRQLLMVSGGDTMDMGAVDLNQLATELVILLRSTIEPTELKVELSLLELPLIEIDRAQVTQVILNLVTNAADAARMRPGHQVLLRTGCGYLTEQELNRCRTLDKTCPPGTYVWLEVADNGPGMDQECQRRMFDPFFSTKAMGRGLGLATVIRVVSRHGGALLVDSQPDDGTKIRVFFPASNHVESEDLTTNHATVVQGDEDCVSIDRNVLLVDDDDSVRRAVSRVLSKHGFQCSAFSSGAECLEFVNQSRDFEAAIVDLSMPQMCGADLIHELRKHRPQLPIVAISGYSSDTSSSTRLPKDCPHFLGKPFTARQLLEKLDQSLASN